MQGVWLALVELLGFLARFCKGHAADLGWVGGSPSLPRAATARGLDCRRGASGASWIAACKMFPRRWAARMRKGSHPACICGKEEGLAIARFLFSLSKQSISRNTELQESGEWEARKGKKNRHGALVKRRPRREQTREKREREGLTVTWLSARALASVAVAGVAGVACVACVACVGVVA